MRLPEPQVPEGQKDPDDPNDPTDPSHPSDQKDPKGPRDPPDPESARHRILLRSALHPSAGLIRGPKRYKRDIFSSARRVGGPIGLQPFKGTDALEAPEGSATIIAPNPPSAQEFDALGGFVPRWEVERGTPYVAFLWRPSFARRAAAQQVRVFKLPFLIPPRPERRPPQDHMFNPRHRARADLPSGRARTPRSARRLDEGIALRYVEANQRPSGAPAAPTQRGTGGCSPGSSLARFTVATASLPATRLDQDAQDPFPAAPLFLQRPSSHFHPQVPVPGPGPRGPPAVPGSGARRVPAGRLRSWHGRRSGGPGARYGHDSQPVESRRGG